jgi:heat shock protein HtpX
MSGGGSGSSSSNRKGGAGAAILIAIVIIAVAWGLSIVIRFALSRTREFLADAGAVELTKNPDAMIMALRKIEGRGELPGVTSSVMEMCVDNPREGFADLFATHPSIESRIEALVRTAGGRDPGPLALSDPGDEEFAEDAETGDNSGTAEPASQPAPPAKPGTPAGPWNPTEVLTRGPWGGGNR